MKPCEYNNEHNCPNILSGKNFESNPILIFDNPKVVYISLNNQIKWMLYVGKYTVFLLLIVLQALTLT